MPKTIVVTGTATGIGQATVNKFEAEGWNVVATVRKESDLKPTPTSATAPRQAGDPRGRGRVAHAGTVRLG
jgi:NAD(P)-dependent dehydrogenase (short-subunit alcohol dehydrogenase family)